MALDGVVAATADLGSLRDAVAAAQTRRDAAIRAAFDAGEPIVVIARAAKLTRARVSSILGHPYERVGRPARSVSRP